MFTKYIYIFKKYSEYTKNFGFFLIFFKELGNWFYKVSLF